MLWFNSILVADILRTDIWADRYPEPRLSMKLALRIYPDSTYKNALPRCTLVHVKIGREKSPKVENNLHIIALPHTVCGYTKKKGLTWRFFSQDLPNIRNIVAGNRTQNKLQLTEPLSIHVQPGNNDSYQSVGKC